MQAIVLVAAALPKEEYARMPAHASEFMSHAKIAGNTRESERINITLLGG